MSFRISGLNITMIIHCLNLGSMLIINEKQTMLHIYINAIYTRVCFIIIPDYRHLRQLLCLNNRNSDRTGRCCRMNRNSLFIPTIQFNERQLSLASPAYRLLKKRKKKIIRPLSFHPQSDKSRRNCSCEDL